MLKQLRIFKGTELKLLSKTPERVEWEMVLIDDKNGQRNRNGAILNSYHFLMDNDESKSLGVNFDHETSYFAESGISDLNIEIKNNFPILTGKVYSTNPEVIKDADKVTAPSVEFYTIGEIFIDSKGREMYEGVDFKGVALLRGQSQGAGGARIRKLKMYNENAIDLDAEVSKTDSDKPNLKEFKTEISDLNKRIEDIEKVKDSNSHAYSEGDYVCLKDGDEIVQIKHISNKDQKRIYSLQKSDGAVTEMLIPSDSEPEFKALSASDAIKYYVQNRSEVNQKALDIETQVQTAREYLKAMKEVSQVVVASRDVPKTGSGRSFKELLSNLLPITF